MGTGGVQLGVAGGSVGQGGAFIRTSVLVPAAVAAARLWFLPFGLPAGWEGFDSSLPCAKQPGQQRRQSQEN